MFTKSLAAATVLALVGQASANPAPYRAPIRHDNAVSIDENGNTWETPGLVYIGWDNGYGIKCDDGSLWLCLHDRSACNKQFAETICRVPQVLEYEGPQQFRPTPQQYRPAPQHFRPAPQQYRPTPQEYRPEPQEFRPNPE
ncbi:hypothetical protein HK102_011673, partial [Quaeritorhiza haematococci]